MKNLTKVLMVACTLIAIVFFSNTAKAEIAVSETINVADTADAKAKEYIAYFKEGAKLGPLNKAMTIAIDTSYQDVLVVQLDNCKSIGSSVKGPGTQFVARVKLTTGKVVWILASNSDQLLGTLNAAYYPPNTTTISNISWKQGDQGDDAVEIPASAIL